MEKNNKTVLAVGQIISGLIDKVAVASQKGPLGPVGDQFYKDTMNEIKPVMELAETGRITSLPGDEPHRTMAQVHNEGQLELMDRTKKHIESRMSQIKGEMVSSFCDTEKARAALRELQITWNIINGNDL